MLIMTGALFLQAGYNEQQLKKFYYSYCADPRIEYDADAWIEAFCLDQERVWYTPAAAKKLEAYNWNTYYHTEIDPYDIPYKPGGLIFFTWDGSGRYFNHVAMVVSYDEDTHVLTYINGNTEGQVITRMMDLDNEEEFYGKPLLKNSGRIMAYGEYDEIKPLEQKEITADTTEIVWDVDSGSGISVQTNSDSKIVSVSIDGVYLGSNIESNMIMHEGKVSIGNSEIAALSHGRHEMQLAFDDGVLMVSLIVIQMKDINAEPASITWDRSGGDIKIKTNSESDTVTIRMDGGLVGTEETDGISIENGTVTLSAAFVNSVLADGENTLKLIFADGEADISIIVTNEKNEGKTDEDSDSSTDKEPDAKPGEDETPKKDEGETSDTDDSNKPDTDENNTPDTDDSNKPDTDENNTLDTDDSSKPNTDESNTPDKDEGNTSDTDESNTPDTNEGNTPYTGDSYPIAVLAVIAAAFFVIVVSARKKTGKTYGNL